MNHTFAYHLKRYFRMDSPYKRAHAEPVHKMSELSYARLYEKQ